MPNKETTKAREENDILFDHFRNALHDHQIPVDEKCWDNISTRIKPKNRSALWLSISSVAAAAAVIIFLLIFDLPRDPSNLQIISVKQGDVSIKGANADNRTGTVASNLTPPTDISESTINNASNIRNISALHNARKAITFGTVKNVVNNTEPTFKTEAGDEPSKETVAKEIKEVTKTTSSETKKLIESTIVQDDNAKKTDYYADNDNIQLSEEKNDNSWKLSASMGTYGKSSSSIKNNHQAERYLMNDQSLAIAAKPISDAEYSIPFSVGLLVRKEVNRNLSLETGLVYTYLATTYKDINNQYRAKMKLHYIGVPVNLIIDIWNVSPQFKIYAGSGIMLEKGIRSDYSQYLFETKESTTFETSIEGVQWSLNAYVGFSYKIYSNWNIYIEPHLSYYFVNDQPVSIRTQKQTVPGFISGFRLDL